MKSEPIARDLFRDRILVLDGAMGTMIQQAIKAESVSGGDNELLNIRWPSLIADIHSRYIAAGADIIETNTFGANRFSQENYGQQENAAQMAFEGARIAREVADKSPRKVWVAGSMGPTGKSLTLAQKLDDPDARACTFDEMVEACGEQIRALIRGGADFLLLETCFDALNTKAALYAAEKVSGEEGIAPFPVMISVTSSDRSGRTLTGQTLEAFYTSVRHYPALLAFGINCSLGPAEMRPLVEEISRFSDLPLICYPNAGLPNELGGYDETPESMAPVLGDMAKAGLLNIVGGCCGTTPAHIKAFSEAVSGVKPRAEKPGYGSLTVCGLEAVHIDLRHSNFTNVGERTNVAGSRKFARLISAGDYDTALRIAAGQIEGGASVIDINVDDAMLDSRLEMGKFVRRVENDPDVAKAALMIDSSHWDTLIEGLKNAQGKCIVNSISLKEGPDVMLSRAKEIHRLGAAMVVMAFDEQGQATTFERKTAICSRAYKLLTESGIPPTDLIFDNNVLAVGTGIAEHAKYAIDFIEAVRWEKQNLPGALTSGGISNLSFSFRGQNVIREAMHSVFLYYAVQAGLDMGIVNPGMLVPYDDIDPELRSRVEDLLFDKREDATERLLEWASEAAAKAENTGSDSSKPSGNGAEGLTVEERLSRALLRGGSDTLSDDVIECLHAHGDNAVSVIEGPLMAGMEEVGRRFGAGKMFLPQVVKSAKVMREAVDVLEPWMDASKDSGASSRPLVVIATVKGDVHDIGKNIVAMVLRCNGFDVHDLGVMVDKETILDTAQKEGADLVAVSGLITPSLFQMEEICREMTRRGMDLPLFIGGATTSALHTAVKLAPLYPHVFYGGDASMTAVMAKKALSPAREEFEREQHEAQQKLRELRDLHDNRPASSGLKNTERKPFPAESFLGKELYHKIPDFDGKEIAIEELRPFMDWRMFLLVCGFKYSGEMPPEARETLEEGKRLLCQYEESHSVIVRVSAKYADCHSENDTIVFRDRKPGGKEFLRLPMMRQEDGALQSLCDFVPDGSTGIESFAGIFAISVHDNAPSSSEKDLVTHALQVTLAEACSEWLDNFLKEMIGDPKVKVIKPAAGYASCPDHTLKREILSALDAENRLGIRLTESYAMIPEASICGLVFAHPEACYPEIHHLSEENIRSYAKVRGFSPEETRRFLGHLMQ